MGTLKIVTEKQYPQILNIHWYQEQLCGTYTNTLLKDKVTETLPLGSIRPLLLPLLTH